MLKQVISYVSRIVKISKLNPSPQTHPHPQAVFIDKKPIVNLQSVSLNQNYTRRPKKLLARSLTSTNTTKTNKMHGPTDDKIVWMDLEMTGLDINKDVIMEIGCIITGPNLEELARHPEIVINVPTSLLDTMDLWCVTTHGASGLTEACRNSTLSTLQGEDMLLAFLKKHTEPGICPLGGNSVSVDRMFLNKYMPRIIKHLHYRCVDVSTIKEVVRRWYPKDFSECPPKRYIHKTIADIEDSISELKYYKSKFFIPAQDSNIEPASQVPNSQ